MVVLREFTSRFPGGHDIQSRLRIIGRHNSNLKRFVYGKSHGRRHKNQDSDHSPGAAFAETGFEATTVREICRRAEVNVAAVNYHFGDKQRLYTEAILHAHRFRIQQVPMPEWTAETPAEDRLRDFVRTMAERLLGEHELPWQESLVMREMFQPTDACRELADDFIRPHFQLLLSIVSDLVPASTPIHIRQRIGFSIVGQVLFYKFNQPIIEILIPSPERAGYFSPDELADHVVRFTLAALSQYNSTGSIQQPVGDEQAETHNDE